MNFERAVEHILKYEGGFVHHPKDPGAATNFGISQRAFPDEDIKNLTVERAKELYRRHYWDHLGIEKLPGFIRLMAFDCAVNQGPRSAIILLQEVLKVPSDGVIGPMTAHAASNTPPTKLVGRYMQVRARRYQAIHSFQTFGAGWMKRLIDVSAETLISIGD